MLFCSAALAGHAFDIRDASEFFDVKIEVETCADNACSGKASYSFYKKGHKEPYQVVHLPDTYIQMNDKHRPLVGIINNYDNQSAFIVGDFNFDGMEDIAICNGLHGSYGMPSYLIYLSSKATHSFVYDKNFSALGSHLIAPEIDKEKKIIRIFDKSGCCWHVTEEYSVVGNRPVKVLEVVEDATIKDETKIKVTTKILVNGKWQTSIKFIPRTE